jgi:hypothetical protein
VQEVDEKKVLRPCLNLAQDKVIKTVSLIRWQGADLIKARSFTECFTNRPDICQQPISSSFYFGN